MTTYTAAQFNPAQPAQPPTPPTHAVKKADPLPEVERETVGTGKDSLGIPFANFDITWVTATEVLYTTGPGFIFVSEKNEQCHPVVTCKDYLGDMVFATVNDWEVTRTNDYFKYSTATCPRICTDKMKIIFCNRKDTEFSKTIHKCVDIIHQAEDTFGIKRSRITRIRNPISSYKKTGMYMFAGSGAWMSSPVMLSLYTLLIRVGTAHTIGMPWLETMEKVATGVETTKNDYYDRGICRDALVGIARFTNEGGWRKVLGTNLKKNYPNEIREGRTHSNFGIQAFSSNHSAQWCPHWYPDGTQPAVAYDDDDDDWLDEDDDDWLDDVDDDDEDDDD